VVDVSGTYPTRSFLCLSLTLLLALSVAGCATARIENQPLAQYSPGEGYGIRLPKTPSGGKLRVVLAFSGGGTRAAALAYGVLKELRETEISLDGKRIRLLDEVSLISSVSGGSFTSAYYGLRGEGIFEEFEDRFLRKNLMSRLSLSVLRPIEFMRIAFTPYTRSDMAMDVYDKQVFGGATFEDLAARGGPVLNINATDIDVGAVFTFTQPTFNVICSDLSKLRVSQAVTASSAVPGIFAPLLLRNHAGSCDFPDPPWIEQALAHPQASRRRHHDALSAVTYLDSEKRPYVFLVDGGVADNIGARRLIADVIDSGGIAQVTGKRDIEVPEYAIYIIVNAQAEGHHDWDTNQSLPSLRSVLSSISGTGIYRYNFDTIELLRRSAKDWESEAAKQGDSLDSFVAEVAFSNLPDGGERDFFNGVATSWNLDDETIDRLIEVGGRLLRDSPDFKRFIKAMK
jgi:NTE family protein